MGPFQGVKILDMSTGITGPYLAMLFGDLSAEVIKVDTGDYETYKDNPGYLVWNRGKRSLKLDANLTESREVVHKLLAAVDVLIISFNSPLIAPFDLYYYSIREKYAGLIYCSISPWGESGPLVNKPASGRSVLAHSGYIANQASFSGNPVYVNMPYAELRAAIFGASGLTAALIANFKTGKGQKLELSILMDGALTWIWSSLINTSVIDVTTPFGHTPVYSIYQTKDGWVQIAAGNTTFCGKLFIAMDQPELISDPRFVNVPW